MCQKLDTTYLAPEPEDWTQLRPVHDCDPNIIRIEAPVQSIRLNYYLLYDYYQCSTPPPFRAVQCDDHFE